MMPPSVNYHLWEPCNMRCRFCFATFQDVKREVLPRGHLPADRSLLVVRTLASQFDKITFAGGEPTLCPWLPTLLREAREGGATTMLVTNGSMLLGQLDALAPNLDWVTLSVDSAREETRVTLGRAIRGRVPMETTRLIQLAEEVRARGIGLKVNTVVTSLQRHEDMSEMILAMRPSRWKLLQVLPVEGQNSGTVEPLLTDEASFSSFVERHRLLVEPHEIVLVPEANADMRGSYAMVDPAGRFFDNTAGGHTYSEPLLDVGLERAWSQVRFNADRFERRGGDYDWSNQR